VKLDILVQRDGKAGDVDVADSSGFDPYDKAALAAVRGAIFLPAINQGMPVESRMAYEISFGLLCNRAAGGSPNCDNGRYPQSCSATVCALLLR
jgi:TonB family protein